MSFPLSPPPASDTGALTCPRQLQRWLDVNPVSKLTRTQGYITVPAIDYTGVANGRIITPVIITCTATNSFSLKGTFTELDTTIQAAIIPAVVHAYFEGVMVCISWNANDGVSHRYMLSQQTINPLTNVAYTYPIVIDEYSGQVIKPNFAIEIWYSNRSVLSSPSYILTINAYQLLTSVLGAIDYRWGVDFSVLSTTLTTTYENLFAPSDGAGNIPLPIIWPTGAVSLPN